MLQTNFYLFFIIFTGEETNFIERVVSCLVLEELWYNQNIPKI